MKAGLARIGQRLGRLDSKGSWVVVIILPPAAGSFVVVCCRGVAYGVLGSNPPLPEIIYHSLQARIDVSNSPTSYSGDRLRGMATIP